MILRLRFIDFNYNKIINLFLLFLEFLVKTYLTTYNWKFLGFAESFRNRS